MKIKINPIKRNELQLNIQRKYRTLVVENKVKYNRNRSKKEVLKEVKAYYE